MTTIETTTAAAIPLTAAEIDRLSYDRDSTIAAIRAALKRRSGKAWSVKGGRGTSWGWISVDAPPARCTGRHVPKPHNIIAQAPGVENWDYVDTGVRGGGITPADLAELGALRSLEYVHTQGLKIPACGDYYREYVERAHGLPVTKAGEPYWD